MFGRHFSHFCYGLLKTLHFTIGILCLDKDLLLLLIVNCLRNQNIKVWMSSSRPTKKKKKRFCYIFEYKKYF